MVLGVRGRADFGTAVRAVLDSARRPAGTRLVDVPRRMWSWL
ncbi:hypothetical protein ACGF5O_03210 [Streptomyces sp. NPDC048291]